MARYATPLTTAPPIPAIDNRVEVLICEARLVHCATNKPEDIVEEHLLTVLVSFDPTPAQRWSARALAATYISAQCQFWQLPQGCELEEWLVGLLNRVAGNSLSIVFSLPLVYCENVANQISGFLTTIRNAPPNMLQLAVAVGLKSFAWDSSDGIKNFVVSSAERVEQAALEVFTILAALMAPGLSAPVDADDLKVALGSSQRPSELASGVWVQAQNIFIPATAEDQQTIEKASAIAFMPLGLLGLSSLAALLKAIRKSTAADTSFVMVAPYGMTSTPFWAGQVMPVQLLIAPTFDEATS